MASKINQNALVSAAEDFLSSAKVFDGSQSARAKLMKQADNLRIFSEDGFGTLMRQIEVVGTSLWFNYLYSPATVSSHWCTQRLVIYRSIARPASERHC